MSRKASSTRIWPAARKRSRNAPQSRQNSRKQAMTVLSISACLRRTVRLVKIWQSRLEALMCNLPYACYVCARVPLVIHEEFIHKEYKHTIM